MAEMTDRQKVEEIIRTCARLYIMPYFRKLKHEHISFKNNDDQNPVTIADEKSELFLESKLSALINGSVVVGEENYESDKSILDYLKNPDNFVWVIDPIDGTSNFKDGKDTFCVMVALVAHGKAQLGWIYDVVNDSMAFAARGEGCFIDGQKVTLDNTLPLEGQMGFTRSKHAHRLENVQTRTLRCAGHEYLGLLKGQGVFSLYSYMNAWDHLAGTLMVQEAGGVVRTWTGQEYKPQDKSSGIISANNEDNWLQIKTFVDAVRNKQGKS